MRNYFFALFLLCILTSFGQNYVAQINEFRIGYMNGFLIDPHSPLKKEDVKYLRFYEVDSTYRVTATVEIVANAQTFDMPTFSGATQEQIPYALLKFTLNGKPMQLTVYKSVFLSRQPQYKDYLFLPFTDETNGKTTYEGGRYIDLSAKDIKGSTMVIDFNKAYNPYCAFGGGYSCPKPPDENHLQFAVEAGEKLFAGQKKH